MSDFNTRLKERIGPLLDNLERNRIELLALRSKAVKKWLALSPFFIIFAVGIGFLGVPMPFALIGGVVIYCITGLIMYSKMTGDTAAHFEHGYKINLVGGIAKFLQPRMEYYPYKGISKSLFKSSGHYNSSIDRYSSEDMFSGTIGETEVMFSEVLAEREDESTDSDGNKRTTWVTVFRGVFFGADFNKHFSTWVTVRPDNETDGFFGWIGKTMEKLRSNVVKLENPEFEQHFRVQAGDDMQARYILTPDMQERLLDLRQNLGGKMILSFQRSNVYITVPKSKNWFEPNAKISVHSDAQINKLANQMHTFFSIVEMLNLNTRIWTKE